MAAATLSAIALLGWMDREEAITLLLEQCVFDSPLDRQQAEALWTQYHDRVGTLPARNPQPPQPPNRSSKPGGRRGLLGKTPGAGSE